MFQLWTWFTLSPLECSTFCLLPCRANSTNCNTIYPGYHGNHGLPLAIVLAQHMIRSSATRVRHLSVPVRTFSHPSFSNYRSYDMKQYLQYGDSPSWHNTNTRLLALLSSSSRVNTYGRTDVRRTDVTKPKCHLFIHLVRRTHFNGCRYITVTRVTVLNSVNISTFEAFRLKFLESSLLLSKIKCFDILKLLNI